MLPNVGISVLSVLQELKSAIKMTIIYRDSSDLLFVLVSGSCPIFLCLGSIDHDGLPTDLLIAHCQGHQDRLWRVELNIGDSNRNNNVVKA